MRRPAIGAQKGPCSVRASIDGVVRRRGRCARVLRRGTRPWQASVSPTTALCHRRAPPWVRPPPGPSPPPPPRIVAAAPPLAAAAAIPRLSSPGPRWPPRPMASSPGSPDGHPNARRASSPQRASRAAMPHHRNFQVMSVEEDATHRHGCQDGNRAGALQLLGVMVEGRAERNTITYNAAISACEQGGEWAMELLGAMVQG